MIMPGHSEGGVRATGGQVDEMVMAMIDSAYDKNEDTQEMIGSALLELGRKQPALVLSSCYTYLKKHSKLNHGHRVVILNAIEKILKETLDELKESLAADLIAQASEELTESKEVVPEWQTAASGVLVAVGKKYCTLVMENLVAKFQPGVMPHFFVVQTMANLATANSFGIVPFLNVVLGTMLPLLGMAKHDNMKWVFSSALGKFSEAILDYVVNIEKAPDPNVKKEAFAGEIYSAYDILFNVWLQSKEAKLRLAIVDALGNMAHIMSRENLEEQLPRLISGILNLYKKHAAESFHITQGLCMVLDAAVQGECTILEPHLDLVLNNLFTQACSLPDFNVPGSIKNHNEVLRCFSVIATAFSDRLVGYLLTKLETSNERTKIATLIIFKQLINTGGEAMENKKALIVSGLKGLALNETNNKVKKVIAQVVSAMAHHGHLEEEGGQLMVDFVIRQCSLPDDTKTRSNDPEYVSNWALRKMCENVLHLITTTIEGIDVVLWPYLLEFLLPVQHTDAMGVICKNVAFLASQKRENNDEDYMIDFEDKANVPKPTAMIARLIVLAGRPTNGGNRGLHVLQAMQGLSPNLNEGLVELWDTVIPKLVQYLEGAEDEKWNQKNWEDLALKMLSKSLDEVNDEDWIEELGAVMGEQIPLYTNYPEEKNFIFKCIGIIMRKSTKKEFVNKHLTVLFNSVNHTHQVEREGVAIAFGFAASSHLDSVLTKLESVAKNEMAKKSSGFLGFLKEKATSSDTDLEKIKATTMLCYGFVTLYAPATLIVSRIEATIMRSITPHFSHVKDNMVKQNLIRTVELIGKALHPDHLMQTHSLTNRGELLGHMQDLFGNVWRLADLQGYMKAEGTAHLPSETRALAMNACATLVKLDPILSDAELFDLIKTSTDCVFPLPLDGTTGKKGKEDPDQQLEHEVLLESTLEALDDLLKEILLKNLSPAGLESIFKHLVPWMLSIHEHERLRAIRTTHTLLQCYLEKFEFGMGSGSPVFTTLQLLLGRLIPRCTDSEVDIRQLSIETVQTTLKIQLRYEGNPPGHKDQMVDALPTLKDRVKKNDPNLLFSVINDLSKVLAKKVPSGQLQGLVDLLMQGLLDSQSHSSSGACVALNSLFKSRGGELHEQVSRLIRELHDKLALITYPQTRTGTLRAIRTLATHHLISVVTALLNFRLPYDEHIVDCWKTLAQDAQLTNSIFSHILELLSRSLPYEEKASNNDKEDPIRTACQLPLAATSALHVIFQVEETEAQVLQNYNRLFVSLLIEICSMLDVQPPKEKKDDTKEETKSPRGKKGAQPKEVKLVPSNMCVEAFKGLLERSKSEGVMEDLDAENTWENLQNKETFTEAVTTLARSVCTHQGECVAKLVSCLTPVFTSLYDPQRIGAVAFCAELIQQRCAGDLTLVELLMNSLLGRLVDSNHKVRMVCIRGLGNVSSVGSEQVQKFSTTVLSAMMAGMDDKDDIDDDITLEAMEGLSKLLEQINESHIRAILINISLKIRPCFEKDKEAVRAAAFTLFGNLSKFGDGPSRAPFLEQIHTNFVSLLLHLNDPEEQVQKSCKFALRLLGPLMGSTAINGMFQKHLLEDARLHYGEFMNDLSKIIIKDIPDKVNFYVMGCVSFFKSQWPEIKCNAAMFAGFLMGNLSKDKHTLVSKEHVCGALILLLKDSSPSVRSKAAEAMSWLYDY
ncbi:maestro heat-like repeat-containing protein family member 1 isoform X1 [Lingula anatina]|uniref:Maestro heat-like repeat-containing protein family member 1 isoform X1 n=1 Tax=Lingula anatina TaxID=7574 RepID=A0A1S3I3J3_LINAN|nr:maestro heat-like repeat-containing protein family member 1 isoform X1 [Lingula anatina]|eukprot:XP_013392835.1 maestro heat-like repeat-containing protein family member 1 isoform X1 [Lingula anatina]